MDEVQGLSRESFRRIIQWWRDEPVVFVREILGIELWSKQKEIIEGIRDNPRITVRSCSGAGKTVAAACTILWFLYCFRPATVLTTGKSFRQIKEQLWRDIGAYHSRARIPLGGDINQTNLNISEDWFALGFSTDEPERITGFHNENVLVVADEASGLGDNVYGAIENPLSAGNTKLLLLGNPTQSTGKFKDSFASPLYKSFHISAFDTPNLLGEEGYPFLVNAKAVENAKIEWGVDSPLYEVYILGEFPSGETDRLIPFGLAEAAIIAEMKEEGTVAMGVDTARFGDDENVLYVRKGNKVVYHKVWTKADTGTTINQIASKIREYKPSVVNIDEGYNPGVIDGLVAQKFNVNGISFGGQAKDPKIFANIRAEMWWEMAERFKRGEIQIPNDKILLKQLTDIKKKPLNRLDQIILESKQEMKQRGLKSPDRADALALCFYELPRKSTSPLWWVEVD